MNRRYLTLEDRWEYLDMMDEEGEKSWLERQHERDEAMADEDRDRYHEEGIF